MQGLLQIGIYNNSEFDKDYYWLIKIVRITNIYIHLLINYLELSVLKWRYLTKTHKYSEEKSSSNSNKSNTSNKKQDC